MHEHPAPLLCSLRIIRTQLPELPDSWKHKRLKWTHPLPPPSETDTQNCLPFSIPIKWDGGRQCPLTWFKPFDPIDQTICILSHNQGTHPHKHTQMHMRIPNMQWHRAWPPFPPRARGLYDGDRNKSENLTSPPQTDSKGLCSVTTAESSVWGFPCRSQKPCLSADIGPSRNNVLLYNA